MSVLCRDCKHCTVPYKYHASAEPWGGWSEYFWDRAMCGATPDFVTGGGKVHRRCSEERADPNGCGPQALNFEAEPPPPPEPEEAPRKGFWSRLFGGAV